MSFFYLTLVSAAADMSPAPLARAIDRLAAGGLGLAGDPTWLAQHKAADIPLQGRPDRSQMEDLRALFESELIDMFVTPVEGRRKKLLLSDMDATIVAGETLDELAARAGLKDRIATITARAMRGELPFEDALRERVAMLEGLAETALQETLDETSLIPGAETLVRTMTAHGATCVLVSGGFTFFTGAVAQRCGFAHHHGNILHSRDGVLCGTVADPILGKEAKETLLREHAAKLGLAPVDALALGDGANDLPMLQAAGLGIGFQPKPLLRENLDNLIIHGDLTAALYAQGYREEELALS